MIFRVTKHRVHVYVLVFNRTHAIYTLYIHVCPTSSSIRVVPRLSHVSRNFHTQVTIISFLTMRNTRSCALDSDPARALFLFLFFFFFFVKYKHRSKHNGCLHSHSVARYSYTGGDCTSGRIIQMSGVGCTALVLRRREAIADRSINRSIR